MATTQPIRDIKHIQAIAEYFLRRGEHRNYCLFSFGIYTALRVSDMLRLRWDDVYDFDRNRAKEHISVIEKKTNKSKVVAINGDLADVLAFCRKRANPRAGAFLFENARTKRPISRVQAYRVIRAASEALALPQRVSCHSLRKTFGYHAMKAGASPAVLTALYNHSSFWVTLRYLGITQDEFDEVYRGLKLLGRPSSAA